MPSNLKLIRLEKGLTIAEVVKASGVAERTIRRIENSRANPRLKTLKRLAYVYCKNITISYIGGQGDL